MIITEADVWEALREVPDPEIPAISIVDLGIVRRVAVGDGGSVRVEIMPTFIACPAIDMICDDARAKLLPLAPDVEVRVTYEEQWTSERITAQGHADLLAAGFAPPVTPAPALGDHLFPLTLHASIACPFCGSRRTRLENAFGPTLCRAIWHCDACRQPFEQFKPV